ncbi:hypothetical protein MIND_00639900 [Mycena indigotica]|uniref:Uncharacterized protein n=1 Tax=Mycena indigotica TaxID=2126181 RepID=A0A8H6SRI0_9AGAR|nr:uncharacterized protein MIND_00639900 [Mycena indigotica]KAF7304084.1 hypothetical protein MIND_00639900 [Mycena indigotica]
MPKAPWKAPDDIFEESSDGLRVRCKICHAEGKGRVGGWIKQLPIIGTERAKKKLKRSDSTRPYIATAFTAYEPRTHSVSAVRNEDLAMFPSPSGDLHDAMQIDDSEPAFELQRLMEVRADDVAAEAAAQAEEEALAGEDSIREGYRRLLTAAIARGELGMEEEEEGDLTDSDHEASDDDPLESEDSTVDPDEGNNNCFPYPNKTIMLLDVMDNLAVSNTIASEPQKIRTSLGNIFYINDIRATIARDFANPVVAQHIHLFPEDVSKGKPISETWQAERWKEYEPTQLTPMFSRGQRRFWVDELARRHDGSFVIPRSLVVRNGVLSTDAQTVTRSVDGCWHYNENAHIESFPVDELDWDFTLVIEMLAAEGDGALRWSSASSPAPPMPNPLRAKVAEDEDLVVVMADIFQDNTSGNVSKQWDKHLVTCVRNGNLPGRLLQQEFNVKFVSSSQHASCAEQFAAIRDIVKATEDDPIHCYNVHIRKKTVVILRPPSLPGDNPQQSEESSHIGCNGNYPCRKCNWGGSTIEKTSEDRCKHVQRLENQLALAVQGDLKSIKEQQTSTGTKDKLTQLWIDRTLAETPPVEVLHTVLLGVMKYIWHFMNTKQWSESDRCLLAIRLQSTDISGLTIPPIRAAYIIQYRNSLIGKHFKTLMQTLAFAVHDICSPEQFGLIKAAGDLGARLWIPEIDDMDIYLADLKIAIANLLDAFDAVDPLRILVKIKLHLLAHLPDNIRRLLCPESNRLSPSRDIATKFASIERVRHVLCGGTWYDARRNVWVHAGNAVLRLLHDDPVFQRHLGWAPPKPIQPGQTRLSSEKKQPPVMWSQTKSCLHWRVNLGDEPVANSQWRFALTIIAKNGDVIRSGSWVYASNAFGKPILGRVVEILVGAMTVVGIEQFVCTEQLHADLGWPVIRRPRGEDITRDGIDMTADKGDANQWCWEENDRNARKRLERSCWFGTQMMNILFSIWRAYTTLWSFAAFLPAHFTHLKPLHEDRWSFHNETAAKAKQLRMTNRDKAAEKRRAKAAEKKKQAEQAAAEADAEVEAAEKGSGEDIFDLVDPDEVPELVPEGESDVEEEEVPFVDDMEDRDYSPVKRQQIQGTATAPRRSARVPVERTRTY